MTKTRILLNLINNTGSEGIEFDELIALALRTNQLEPSWCREILRQREKAGVIERIEDNRWRMVEQDRFTRRGNGRAKPPADEAASEVEAGDELSVMVDMVARSIVIEHNGGRLILSAEHAAQLAELCGQASTALAA